MLFKITVGQIPFFIAKFIRLLPKLNVFHMDSTQEALLNEKCILVDENDKVIGEATKKECHLVQPNGDIKLHRAFSVFLFNSKGEILVQKRAATKITYPNRYTNTCCSHPLAEIPGESEEKDALGVRKAAQRRLYQELGISRKEIPLEALTYLTRIHYKDQGDGKYGEHEIDYIIFIQKDVKFNLNQNEVSEVRFLNKQQFRNFVNDKKTHLTPWFELIVKNDKFRLWWDNLNNLNKLKDHEYILRLKF